MKKDSSTGIEYDEYNRPLHEITTILSSNGKYRVWAETANCPETAWYMGHFIGTTYQVQKWIPVSTDTGFYQSVAGPYERYTTAKKKMIQLAETSEH